LLFSLNIIIFSFEFVQLSLRKLLNMISKEKMKKQENE